LEDSAPHNRPLARDVVVIILGNIEKRKTEIRV
jgi:hypothetical protein